MRILVKSDKGQNIRLCFPTCLICNRLTAAIFRAAINEHLDGDLKISACDTRRLLREIKRMKKKSPRMYLVDVESSKATSSK